ncbi:MULTISPECIES: aldehyde dehydrogenase family protein [unclassified Solwaraspora]|uniref:aldehyde dehydrogenase family protein n=1 Tax=unclassified Solwaraspora TaxID=2627926 RepID=UPI00248C5DD3|nr:MULTISPECIES: aldehyde dehydrogenase family protein [unclassified Solwaraspora]WBB99088.1 aldehyde dehydrogenase family protein [Solwaraspora sp. WMMA2059]WBC22359.1 aldehyde dehydrogenase family protein [Solwaraspora sp. WMMA2080]WJK35591.1 aldehyde dehydrogenase family protein [Solwaraspora sp. WMMA2065]
MYDVEQFIDGGWGRFGDGAEIVVEDPSEGTPVSRSPLATEANVDTAVKSAREAAPGWAATPAADRAAALRRIADALAGATDQVAEAQSAEMGKPLAGARAGIAAGVATLRQYAELGPVHRGRALAGDPAALDLMAYVPRGVVAVLTPWNDPVAVACGLLGAALVTGNTVVHKPSERCPATGALLARMVADEVPDGVFALLTGDGGVGARIAASDGVDLVAHVGATDTGRAVAEACARTGAKVLRENGGSDALVVDEGVDPRWAAQQAAAGALANSGQVCVSVERIYVHSTVAEPFVEALTGLCSGMRLGPARDPYTELGPLVDRRHRDQVHAQVSAALAAGATARCGGRIPDGPGAFYPPTVLTGCTDDMAVMRQETFGPVAPVMTVGSFDEALSRAAASPYGLSATVLTRSMSHAQRAWRELPVGTVKINSVFGGAPGGAAHPRRGSGEGLGFGPELLDEMTVVKVLHLQAPGGPDGRW